jgi:hypothetical protein
MSQGATAWAAVVFPSRLGSSRFLASKFSCPRGNERRINECSVNALPPGRGDLLPLARVGSWLVAYALLAFASCPKNELVDQARAAGLTTADFPQITADASDHGR